MKLIVKLVVALVIVLALVVVGTFFMIDRLARVAIERGGSWALGVPVTLEHASVGIRSGKFGMETLVVGNPGGFDSPHFLHLGDGGVEVSFASLREEVVTLPQLWLEDITINLEKRAGKANYTIITENLRRVGSGGDRAPSQDDDGKRFIVNELLIRDVTVNVDLLPIGGDLTRRTLQIERIALNDIGSDNARGVVLSELISIAVRAIMKSAADLGGGIIPSDILGDLGQQLGQFGDLGTLQSQIGERIGESVGEAVDGARERIDEAVEGARDRIEGAREGVEGLGDRFRRP